ASHSRLLGAFTIMLNQELLDADNLLRPIVIGGVDKKRFSVEREAGIVGQLAADDEMRASTQSILVRQGQRKELPLVEQAH
ncbi:MAG: hypothetical protein SNJ83_12510, partial [Aggregatilineales bacterium]